MKPEFLELKEGDKVNIKSDGSPRDTSVCVDGKKMEGVTFIDLKITPDKYSCHLGLVGTIIDLKGVEIDKIIDTNPKIKIINDIVNKYCRDFGDFDSPSGKCLREINKVLCQ